MQNKPKYKIGNMGKIKPALSEVEWVKIGKMNLNFYLGKNYENIPNRTLSENETSFEKSTTKLTAGFIWCFFDMTL